MAERPYVGKNHSDNSLLLRFPRQRILFAVDFIPVQKSHPLPRLPHAYMPEWIESLQRVEMMDFDVLAPGHGPLGTKANVIMFREQSARPAGSRSCGTRGKASPSMR